MKFYHSFLVFFVMAIMACRASAELESPSGDNSPSMANVVEISKKITAQVMAQASQTGWGVAVYRPLKRTKLEYNPDNLDPYMKWLINPKSKVDLRSYVKLELVDAWFGVAPQFVNAAKLAPPAEGMYTSPDKLYSFPSVVCEFYVIVFRGGDESDNFKIYPINDWDSVFGVGDVSSVKAASGALLVGTKFSMLNSDVPVLKALVKEGLSAAKSAVGDLK